MLKDIEKNAKKIAENLDYMLDNLRYSLHAVSVDHNSVNVIIMYYRWLPAQNYQSPFIKRQSMTSM